MQKNCAKLYIDHVLLKPLHKENKNVGLDRVNHPICKVAWQYPCHVCQMKPFSSQFIGLDTYQNALFGYRNHKTTLANRKNWNDFAIIWLSTLYGLWTHLSSCKACKRQVFNSRCSTQYPISLLQMYNKIPRHWTASSAIPLLGDP